MEESVANHIRIDTTNMTTNDIAILVASEVMDVLREKYIEAFQNRYYLK